MNYRRYEIPEKILSEIKQKYINGVSVAKLQATYGYTVSAINSNLRGIRVGFYNAYEKGKESIKDAEKRLIGGTFPDYIFKYDIKSEEDMKKYKSLLNYYAKADLNSKFF